jgi:hypothetical protein
LYGLFLWSYIFESLWSLSNLDKFQKMVV